MKLRNANPQLYEKSSSHILRHVFCLHILRMHLDYFFRRGLGSVRAQFLSRNVSESSVTCNLPVRLRFIQVNFLHVKL